MVFNCDQIARAFSKPAGVGSSRACALIYCIPVTAAANTGSSRQQKQTWAAAVRKSKHQQQPPAKTGEWRLLLVDGGGEREGGGVGPGRARVCKRRGGHLIFVGHLNRIRGGQQGVRAAGVTRLGLTTAPRLQKDCGSNWR